MADIKETLRDRHSTYGDFSECARISNGIDEALRASPNWAALSPDKKRALNAIADKMARIVSGDPDYRDSWHDIQGYAALAYERCRPAEYERDQYALFPESGEPSIVYQNITSRIKST